MLPRESASYVDRETLYIEEGRLEDAIVMYKQAVAANLTTHLYLSKLQNMSAQQ